MRGAAAVEEDEEEEVVRVRRREGEPGGVDRAAGYAVVVGGGGAWRRGVIELQELVSEEAFRAKEGKGAHRCLAFSSACTSCLAMIHSLDLTELWRFKASENGTRACSKSPQCQPALPSRPTSRIGLTSLAIVQAASGCKSPVLPYSFARCYRLHELHRDGVLDEKRRFESER